MNYFHNIYNSVSNPAKGLENDSPLSTFALSLSHKAIVRYGERPILAQIE